MTAILDYDPNGAETLRSALGADVVALPTLDALRRHLDTHLGEDTVVVGSPNESSNASGFNAEVSGGAGTQADDSADRSGAAYVFTRSGNWWTEQQKLIASDGEAGDMFGCNVALHGNTALIGAYEDAVD